jgi:hypothetical protein
MQWRERNNIEPCDHWHIEGTATGIYARGRRRQNSLPSGSRSTCQRPPA